MADQAKTIQMIIAGVASPGAGEFEKHAIDIKNYRRISH